MRFQLAIAFILLFCLSLMAHQAELSTTLLVEKSEDEWVLQIRAALTAFEFEIEQHYGEDSYASPDEFKALVVKHVSQNIEIDGSEGRKVFLKNGLVKLGHETSVTFVIDDLPANMETLKVSNRSFSNINRNQSALIIVKKGFEKKQFMLNGDNQHTANLAVKAASFALIDDLPKSERYKLLFAIGIIVLVVSTLLYFSLRNQKYFFEGRAIMA